ncbi:MAG: hypothetical protein WBP93_22335 [Pyrinomonadaceae bacterium]
MGSKDPVLSLLKDFGYNVVRLPRTNIRPLQLFEKQGNDLVFLGEMPKLFKAGADAPLPAIGPDDQAGFINGQRSRDLNISVGLSILSGIISALGGGTLGLNAGYKKASTLSFVFDDVKVNQIDRLDLSKFLTAAQIDESVGPPAKLVEADKLYVVTSTIKSNKFTTEAKKSDGTSVGVDVPVIQNAMSGKVEVKTEGSSQSKVTYEGNIPLVFGFQAIRLVFENGRFTQAVPVAPTETGMRAIAHGEEPEMLETESPFTSVFIEPDA